ncbi:hypothetical protein [Sorangium sp. So ce1000]|uniref:hypothetical protein n=1 Tax=Sorangium sp. So ce1000 TaxID=3133325 RepID=UPI003F5F432A
MGEPARTVARASGLDTVRRVANTTDGSLDIGHSRLGGARIALVIHAADGGEAAAPALAQQQDRAEETGRKAAKET